MLYSPFFMCTCVYSSLSNREVRFVLSTLAVFTLIWTLFVWIPYSPLSLHWFHLHHYLVAAKSENASQNFSSIQSLSRVWLCDLMDCSTPGLPVHYQLPEFTQTRVHWVSDAIQPSHPLLSPSPPALNLSQHQGLFHWVSSSYQVAKILEFQLQHKSFQWIFRTDFL